MTSQKLKRTRQQTQDNQDMPQPKRRKEAEGSRKTINSSRSRKRRTGGAPPPLSGETSGGQDFSESLSMAPDPQASSVAPSGASLPPLSEAGTLSSLPAAPTTLPNPLPPEPPRDRFHTPDLTLPQDPLPSASPLSLQQSQQPPGERKRQDIIATLPHQPPGWHLQGPPEGSLSRLVDPSSHFDTVSSSSPIILPESRLNEPRQHGTAPLEVSATKENAGTAPNDSPVVDGSPQAERVWDLASTAPSPRVPSPLVVPSLPQPLPPLSPQALPDPLPPLRPMPLVPAEDSTLSASAHLPPRTADKPRPPAFPLLLQTLMNTDSTGATLPEKDLRQGSSSRSVPIALGPDASASSSNTLSETRDKDLWSKRTAKSQVCMVRDSVFFDICL